MFTICEPGEIVNRPEPLQALWDRNLRFVRSNQLFYKCSTKSFPAIASLTIRVTGPIVHELEVFTRRERYSY